MKTQDLIEQIIHDTGHVVVMLERTNGMECLIGEVMMVSTCAEGGVMLHCNEVKNNGSHEAPENPS